MFKFMGKKINTSLCDVINQKFSHKVLDSQNVGQNMPVKQVILLKSLE